MNPAFAYVYDDFTSEPSYARDLIRIENELAVRGISGHVARTVGFRVARNTIADFLQRGVQNVVLVGNDATLVKAISFLPDLDVTIGFIPVAAPMHIADLLGIPMGLPSVDVLAARLVETMDVGRFQQQYFLTEISLPSTQARVEIEGAFRLQPTQGGGIAVRNLGSRIQNGTSSADPKDGFLEVIVQAPLEKKKGMAFWSKPELSETRMLVTHGRILSEKPMDLFVDGTLVRGQEFAFSILPKKLRMITGRNRKLRS